MRSSRDRARIRQKRIMTYFIEAADKIIKEEGLGAVTIRKAADMAGYTSATLYNYFENLTHLVFLGTMNHLEEYNAAIPKCLTGCKNAVDRYLAISECFFEFAFAEPDIYELLFFSTRNAKLEEYTRQYYELFPEKEVNNKAAGPLAKMFNRNNIYSRSSIMLDDCVDEGFITRENAEDFNDVGLMASKCILQEVKVGSMKKKMALEKAMKYYRQLMACYLKPEFRHLVKGATCGG